MSKIEWLVFTALSILTIAYPGSRGVLATASPHHGSVGYDLTKAITLNGTATSFDWLNPHCLLHLDVKDEAGNVQRWTLEMASPTALAHKGWRKDSIMPGDQVTIETHPAKNGIPLGISSGNSYIMRAEVNGKRLPAQ